jgi:hypothetical protein
MTIPNLARIAFIGGSAGLLAFGLMAPASADSSVKRNEDVAAVELVDDDDDEGRDYRDSSNDSSNDATNDSTNNVTRASRDNTENMTGGVSAVSNDNTRSNLTAVSRGDDRSRGDVTRDMTRDGGDLTRDLTADSTNDRTRNDTR